MTRIELVDELRHVVGDRVQPYAWADTRLLNWMAEGQDRFCEKTGYFTDKTNYTIVTEEGVQSYALSSRIIQVKSVWDGTRQLSQFIENDRPVTTTDLSTAQRPLSWQTDQETGMITFYEPMLGGITLTLRVHRKSRLRLNNKTSGQYNAEPEIPEDCHLGLVEYGAYKALMDHDRESQDPVKAGEHLAAFNDYVRLGKDMFERINGASLRVAPSPQYVV